MFEILSKLPQPSVGGIVSFWKCLEVKIVVPNFLNTCLLIPNFLIRSKLYWKNNMPGGQGMEFWKSIKGLPENSESQWYTPISHVVWARAQCPKDKTTGFLKVSLGGPAKTTGLKRVWLSESLGRSLPSVRTARKTSSVNPLSKAPSGTVRVTPRSGNVNTAPVKNKRYILCTW